MLRLAHSRQLSVPRRLPRRLFALLALLAVMPWQALTAEELSKGDVKAPAEKDDASPRRGQLAASDATYELRPWSKVKIDTRNLKDHEQVEIWMTPEGAHEEFPELSIGWVGHTDQPVTVKLPRGKGRAAYWTKVNDQWHDTNFRHPIQVTAVDGPTEITLPPVQSIR
jgi:hypothetical protein